MTRFNFPNLEVVELHAQATFLGSYSINTTRAERALFSTRLHFWRQEMEESKVPQASPLNKISREI